MKALSKFSLAIAFLVGAMQFAQATIITLDFNTNLTGGDLINNPLITPIGTITLTNATSISTSVFHDEGDNPGYAQFDFSFDVTSIQFSYSGNGDGVFTGEVLNIGGDVLDSFFDPDTSSAFLGTTNVVLSGLAIRSFRFADTPGGLSFSSIDNLIIEAAEVPGPATLAILGLGLAGLSFTRRKITY